MQILIRASLDLQNNDGEDNCDQSACQKDDLMLLATDSRCKITDITHLVGMEFL